MRKEIWNSRTRAELWCRLQNVRAAYDGDWEAKFGGVWLGGRGKRRRRFGGREVPFPDSRHAFLVPHRKDTSFRASWNYDVLIKKEKTRFTWIMYFVLCLHPLRYFSYFPEYSLIIAFSGATRFPPLRESTIGNDEWRLFGHPIESTWCMSNCRLGKV